MRIGLLFCAFFWISNAFGIEPEGIFIGFVEPPKTYRIRYSANALGINRSEIVYQAGSPVLALLPYKGGVLNAFYRPEESINKYRVHFSPDGKKLGEGEIVYDGSSPITAMSAFKGGVLTAFARCKGDVRSFCVHFSPDGKNLGGGKRVYEGISPVTAMLPFGEGVLTAYDNAADRQDLSRIHFSPDGENLGGEVRYEGASRVRAMALYRGGVYTAFDVGGEPATYRIHFSPDGQDLGNGTRVYDGASPITGMIAHDGGMLFSFSNARGIADLNSIVFSPDGKNLAEAELRYLGFGVLTAISEHGASASATIVSASAPGDLRIAQADVRAYHEAKAIRPKKDKSIFDVIGDVLVPILVPQVAETLAAVRVTEKSAELTVDRIKTEIDRFKGVAAGIGERNIGKLISNELKYKAGVWIAPAVGTLQMTTELVPGVLPDVEMEAPTFSAVAFDKFPDTTAPVVYVNGMQTPKDAALEDAWALSRHLNRPVNLRYDEAQNELLDVVAAIADRTAFSALAPTSVTVRQLAHHICHTTRYISIVSHSKGCILVRNALVVAERNCPGIAGRAVAWIATGSPLNDREVWVKPAKFKNLRNPDDLVVAQLLSGNFDPDSLRKLEVGGESHIFVDAYLPKVSNNNLFKP